MFTRRRSRSGGCFHLNHHSQGFSRKCHEMNTIIKCLLALLMLCGPALGALSDSGSSSLAAKTTAGAADDAGRYLYHYTNPSAADSIAAGGLRTGRDGFAYATPQDGLSPIQAQIELALPANRPLPGAVLRIDAHAMREAGINPVLGPRRVQGNLPGLGTGGGTELLFDQNIPSQFIQRIK